MDGPTVLVVEDEPPLRELLQEILEDEGYVVLTAADGRTALDLARAEQPALVLSDVMLPELDGVALCTALQAEPQTAPIPVLLMSAGRHRLPAGLATAFVPKPFAISDLLTTIERVIRLG